MDLRRVPLRISLLFMGLSLLWIWVSALFVHSLHIDLEDELWAHIYSGLVFALLTGPVLYASLLRMRRHWEAELEGRRAAEASSQATRTRWLSALEAANHGVWELDLTAQTIQVSPKTLDIVGCADSPPLPSPDAWFDLVHPDDRPTVREAFARYLNGEAPAFHCEYRIHWQKGSLVWVLVRGSIVERDANNRPCRIGGTITDITQQKLTAARLQESEQRNRTILSVLPDLIFILSREGVYLDYHAANPHLLLASPGTFLGKPMEEILPADTCSLFRTFLAQAVTSSEPVTFEYTLPLKGQPHSFEARLVALDSERVLSVVRDVTAQKQTSLELVDSQQRYRQLFQGSPLPTFVYDIGTLAITAVNAAFTEKYGYSEAELLASSVRDISPAEDVSKVLAFEQDMGSHAARNGMIWRHKRKDGALFHVETYSQPITYNNRPSRLVIAIDVTEKTGLEDKLHIEHTKNTTLLNSVTDGIYILSLTGDVLQVNPAFCQQLGYTEAELLRMRVSDWIKNTSHEKTVARIREMVLKGETYETQHQRKDGTLIEVEVSTTTVSLGNQLALLCSSRDISVRKRAEQALRESELRYRSLVEGTGEFVWQCRPDGSLTYVNPAWLQTLGYTAAEVLGRPFGDFQPEDARRTTREEFAYIALGGIGSTHELVLRAKDGSRVFLLSHLAALPKPQEGIQGIASNITSRIAAEAEVRKLSHVVEQSPLSILITNPEGRITYANPGYTRTMGFAAEEVRDTLPPVFAAPDSAAALWPTLRAGKTYRHQYQTRRKDGTPCWEEVAVSALRNSQGEITHFVSFQEDITVRKSAELQLVDSEARFRVLSEHALAGIYIIQDDRFIYVNPALLAILGYRDAHLPTDDPFHYIHPDDHELVRRLLQGNRDTGASGIHTCRAIHRKGHTIYLQLVGARHTIAGKPAIIGHVLDVTAERTATEALRLTTQRLQAHVASTPLGVIEFTPDQHIVSWNPAAQQIFGYSSAEATGRPLGWLIPHLDGTPGLPTDVTFSLEGSSTCIHRTRQGRQIYCEWNHTHLTDHEGRVIGIAALVQDVTNRVVAEKQMREMAAMLSKAQEVAKLGSYVIDIPSQTWTGTPELDRIFGVTADYPHTLDGWAALAVAGEAARLREHLTQVIRDRSRFELEYRILRHHDGQERWVSGLGELECDNSGTPVRMVGTIQDVTERKTAELALHESDRRFRAMLERTELLTVILNASGRVQFANERLLRSTGWTMPEIQDTCWFRRFLPDRPDIEAAFLRGIQERSIPAAFENEIVTKSGAQLTVKWNNTLLFDQDGRAIAVASIGEDVTKSRRAEEATRRAQQFVTVGKLGAGLAHEIRNPLAAVKAVISMLPKEHQNPQFIDQFVPLMADELKRVDVLVDRILELGKPHHYVASFCDILGPLDNVVGLVCIQARQNQVRVEHAWGDGTQMAFADPTLVTQVAMNLVLNAIQAFEGTTLTERQVNISTKRTPEGIELVVSDNGPGIPDMSPTRSFEPFVSTKSSGIGLGLAFCRDLLSQVGASISIDPFVPGQGATVRVLFPHPTKEV